MRNEHLHLETSEKRYDLELHHVEANKGTEELRLYKQNGAGREKFEFSNGWDCVVRNNIPMSLPKCIQEWCRVVLQNAIVRGAELCLNVFHMKHHTAAELWGMARTKWDWTCSVLLYTIIHRFLLQLKTSQSRADHSRMCFYFDSPRCSSKKIIWLVHIQSLRDTTTTPTTFAVCWWQ